jgi:hypothetical protein
MPGGVSRLPYITRFTTEPATGSHLGNHPEMTEAQRDCLLADITRQQIHAFAYTVADVPGCHGNAGSFKIISGARGAHYF